MSVYGYIRVSSQQQADSGLGLEAQVRMIRDYCRARRLRLDRLYRDHAVSAFRARLGSRPAGGELLGIVRSGDHVIIAKIDRAFRSVIDCAQMLREWNLAGVHVHLLDLHVDTSTATGRMLAAIVATIAEWESGRISERIRAALTELRRSGRRANARPPIGFTCDRRGRWVAAPQERATARHIVALRRRGHIWREIAKRMESRRRRNRAGIRWNLQSVHRWARAARASFPRSWRHQESA